MSFRLKTILGVALIEIILLGSLITSSLLSLRSSNEEELLRRANTTAQLLATMTLDGVISSDLATLQSLIDQTLTNDDLIYVRVRHLSGVVLAQGGDAAALKRPFNADDAKSDKGDMILDVAAPITTAGQGFGQVEIGLSSRALDDVIAASARRMALLAVTGIGLVAIFGFMLGTYLSHQLQKLRSAARIVAAGDFGFEMPVVGKDELADTANSFNTMSRALAAYAKQANDARERAEAGQANAETLLNDAINSMPQGIMVLDNELKVEFINKGVSKLYNLDKNQLSVGSPLEDFLEQTSQNIVFEGGKTREAYLAKRWQRLERRSHETWQTMHDNGQVMLHLQRPMSNGGVVVVDTDITELFQALDKNRKLELELMQAHKMEALGTLACGIAHEINTPVQYIGDNVRFLRQSFEELCDFIAAQKAKSEPSFAQELQAVDWEFLSTEMPAALNEALSGVEAVGRIVGSVKAFSHPDQQEKTPYDLNQLVENAIQVSQSQWKDAAQISFTPATFLAPVPCYPGDLGQVLINLFVNAADALNEQPQSQLGEITVVIEQTEAQTSLIISDNGPGIDKKIRGKIFDMFFTTKAPGKGTGQGLAICKSIIDGKHNGRLTLEDTQSGTRFRISLPH